LAGGLAAPTATLAAPAAARIGALEVPADCALARGEHPRLLHVVVDSIPESGSIHFV
jgi:hypothetical protein